MDAALQVYELADVSGHFHDTYGMATANVYACLELGVSTFDTSIAGLGGCPYAKGATGNVASEDVLYLLQGLGIETGVDVFKIQDVAEDLVVPIMDHIIRIDRDSLTLGYAGVYSSFLLFAKRAGAKYGVPSRDLLVELGRRGMVGGQEDMIEDLALNLARERGLRQE
jgi:4-hydroxy-2-oxovalerate/4-hydroxy-2-oxohexanoate aldolase